MEPGAKNEDPTNKAVTETKSSETSTTKPTTATVYEKYRSNDTATTKTTAERPPQFNEPSTTNTVSVPEANSTAKSSTTSTKHESVLEHEPVDSTTTKPPTNKTKSVKNKRKRRRGGGNANKVIRNKDFNVYLVNLRGAKSKLVSLQAIVDDPNVKPDLANLVETNLKGSSKLDVKGFYSFSRNRKNKHMGGVSTLVKENDVKHVLKVSEGAGDNEYLITRHS